MQAARDIEERLAGLEAVLKTRPPKGGLSIQMEPIGGTDETRTQASA